MCTLNTGCFLGPVPPPPLIKQCSAAEFGVLFIDLLALRLAVYFLQKRNEKKEASEKKYYESKQFINRE
jgi:hypothetical protein